MSDSEYHIVDCGDRECALCPAAFRGPGEEDAIATARSHGDTGDVTVVDVGVDGPHPTPDAGGG